MMFSLPSSKRETIANSSCRHAPASNADPRVNDSQLRMELCGVRPTSSEAAVTEIVAPTPSHSMDLLKRRTTAPEAGNANVNTAI